MVSARRARGFTLIELMIALALTTVGLLGLMALQGIAINGNMMSRNFGEAIGIAQQRLEIAERTPYATLAAMIPADPVCATDLSSAQTACAAGTAKVSPTQDLSSTQAVYTRCTTVTNNADNTTTVLTRVCWQDTRANWHRVDLQTRRSP